MRRPISTFSIIMKTGWRGDCDFADPMCGSGTFLVEAALIASNINPGIFRQSFAFEKWPDFDKDLFEELYNDDGDGDAVVIYMDVEEQVGTSHAYRGTTPLGVIEMVHDAILDSICYEFGMGEILAVPNIRK